MVEIGKAIRDLRPGVKRGDSGVTRKVPAVADGAFAGIIRFWI